MNISDFANIFLPHLLADYVAGKLPIHALVDIDTWKKIFPEQPELPSDQFHWYEISFTCNRLQDGTLLFSFILPEPQRVGEPKYAAIRLDLEQKDELKAIYYVLRKPQSIFDNWDIYSLTLPNKKGDMKVKFKCKIKDTDSLRNFVLTVQQISFNEKPGTSSLLGILKQIGNDLFTPQSDEPAVGNTDGARESDS